MAGAQIDKQIVSIFSYLDRKGGKDWSPDAGALRDILIDIWNKNTPHVSGGTATINIGPSTSILFATASVEMWHRSVHSFLVSCANAGTSPIWSSVSGYYSSHFSMRAFSHLLGYFALYKKGTMQVTLDRTYYCEIKKRAPKSEHQEYWKYLNDREPFTSDPLFTNNSLNISDIEKKEIGSDSHHRGFANYVDNINNYGEFRPLDEAYLIARINAISDVITDTPSLPKVDNYPDLDAVHITAYARIIKYRNLLDKILGTKNNYWNSNRTPVWCNKYINYQAPEFSDLQLVSEISA